ncbi:MAG: peptidoglycan-binding domain-containing protein, partial [Eubacteriales bacterium]|nr:peptidoglycan-binding domain-containing protein [Eubacteriales bacterium]
MEQTHNTTCMYCFADTGGANKCPNCGGDANAVVPQDHLIPGTVLNGNWLIGRAVGQDATGIVYVAMDMNKRAKARIREYFPKDCAQRMPDGSVQVVPGEDERYQQGLAALRESAQSADEPEKRHPVFETGNTVYVVQMRKKKAAAAPAREEDAEPSILKKQIFIFAGVIAVLVIGVIIAVSAIGRRAADTVNPGTIATIPPIIHTLEPTEAPAQPTATPTAAPTDDPFANLPTRIPLDWQDVQGTGNNTSDDYYDAYDDIVDKPTPTPAPTLKPGTGSVNPDSPAESIRALQWRLIELAWLDADTASGVYDTDTRYAVAYFQKHIRDQYGANVKANGYADETTLRWLNDSGAPVNPAHTPAPAVTPTPGPSAQPTFTPSAPITGDSEPAVILGLQNRLVELGWLEPEYATGAYNTQTRYAVAYFQKALKDKGIDVSASGYADMLTQTWLAEAGAPRPTPAPTQAPTVYTYQLEQYYFTAIDGKVNKNYDQKDTSTHTTTEATLTIAPPASGHEGYVFAPESEYNRLSNTFTDPAGEYRFIAVYIKQIYTPTVAPSASPTPAPTPAPTQTPAPEPTIEAGPINESSSPERIYALQTRLVELGWMEDPSDATGAYNQQTINAVTAFQDKLMFVHGVSVFDGVEFEQGYADLVTQMYLADENALTPDPTPAPTQNVTPAPTQAPEEETQYSYRVNQYYFTAVDGQMNKEPDYRVEGEIRTTGETSMVISVPESAIEGYTFDGSSVHNTLDLSFSDPNELYTFKIVYIRQTSAPTPAPTQAPMYAYRVNQYYFTAVDGVLNKGYDLMTEGEIMT